jgi:hypothetical protein
MASSASNDCQVDEAAAGILGRADVLRTMGGFSAFTGDETG